MQSSWNCDSCNWVAKALMQLQHLPKLLPNDLCMQSKISVQYLKAELFCGAMMSQPLASTRAGAQATVAVAKPWLHGLMSITEHVALGLGADAMAQQNWFVSPAGSSLSLGSEQQHASCSPPVPRPNVGVRRCCLQRDQLSHDASSSGVDPVPWWMSAQGRIFEPGDGGRGGGPGGEGPGGRGEGPGEGGGDGPHAYLVVMSSS